MTKIRILRVITRLNIGGPAHHVLLLSEHLDKRGYETLLVAGKEPPGEVRAATWQKDRKISLTYLSSMSRGISWGDAWSLMEVGKVIRSFRPDIIHTHTAKAGAVGRIGGMIFAPKALRIHTYHGHYFEGYFPTWVTRNFIRLERYLGRHTNAIITLSDQQKADILHYKITSPEKVHVIPLGLDLSRWAELPSGDLMRQKWGISKDQMVLGFIGRLVPIKNLPLLVDAVARIKDMYSPDKLQVVVVGGGSMYAAWQAYAQNQAPGYFRFVGWEEDIPAVLAALDGLVLTSNNEGTPVSMIEALAAGCPVVASAVGGVPDVAGEGTLLLPPKDVDAWHRGLQAFLRQLPSWKAKACQERQAYQACFHYTRLVNDIDKLYQQLLALR
ncbi:MAG: glycosyltransferase [Bacteroidia bacterium]